MKSQQWGLEILDAFNRQIVGWPMADTLNHRILADALDRVFRRQKPEPGNFGPRTGTLFASIPTLFIQIDNQEETNKVAMKNLTL